MESLEKSKSSRISNKNKIEMRLFQLSHLGLFLEIDAKLYISKKKIKWRQIALASLIGICCPFLSLAQLPDLGLAQDFALFTTIGALAETGTSDITGDVGTNDGAVSGFSAPSTLDGSIEWTNGVTAQCALDVQAAYDELLATPTTNNTHDPIFGNGETITPGVYSIGSAGSVVGELILDADNDADAIFIFKFGGAFSTGDECEVKIINGAGACNIFWIAEGAMSLATLVEMKGTMISNNGAVAMGDGSKLEGRMLSTAGASSVHNGLITIPFCGSILPIELISFSGYSTERNIVLKWSTSSETNCSHFRIEKSLDGENWQVLDIVDGAGNSTDQNNYTLLDQSFFLGSTYYRLNQIDYDGNYKYEAVIYVIKNQNTENELFTIFPNLSVGRFELFFNGNQNEISSIEIYNAQGQKISSIAGFQAKFDLAVSVPGLYFMNIKKNSELFHLKFMIE